MATTSRGRKAGSAPEASKNTNADFQETETSQTAETTERREAPERELPDRAPVEVLGPLLRLNLTHNAGAAFSTGESLTPLISLFAAVAFVVVAVLGTHVRSTGWAWALGLLLAGIAGNLTDRLFRDPGPLRGHVVDFLQLPHWPIFNVADVCINVAAALIVVQSVRGVPLRGREVATDAPEES